MRLRSTRTARRSAPADCCPTVISVAWRSRQSARGGGVGSALLIALMDEARRRGHREAVLSAQTHAIDFYAKHSFSVQGNVYDDAGIPHVDMRRAL